MPEGAFFVSKSEYARGISAPARRRGEERRERGSRKRSVLERLSGRFPKLRNMKHRKPSSPLYSAGMIKKKTTRPDPPDGARGWMVLLIVGYILGLSNFIDILVVNGLRLGIGNFSLAILTEPLILILVVLYVWKTGNLKVMWISAAMCILDFFIIASVGLV